MPTPCVTYTIGRALYVALTNRCNSISLIESRGPSFSPSKFMQPLPVGFEPSPAQVVEAVEQAMSSKREKPSELCFAGVGEPLIRLRALEEAAGLIQQQQPDMLMRINTNGLVPQSEAAAIAKRLHNCGIRAASVAIATADAEQYAELMKPDAIRLTPAFTLPLGHEQVTGFIAACVAAGMSVECNAVARPEVDIEAAGALATSLGASFRERSWHP